MIANRSTGSLVSFETGEAVTYGLYNAQQRGTLLVGAGEKVYEGMVIGYTASGEDVDVNVCKTKHLTNTRASGSDDALRLIPISKLSLEGCLEFLAPDELLEVTPENLAENIKKINAKRSALKRLYDLRKEKNIPISGTDTLLISQIAYYDDPERFTQMVNTLCDELDQRVKDGVSVFPAGTKRILVTGTPMAIPNWKMHNLIETSGAAVVCEETCTGTRYFENNVDESGKTVDEMIDKIAERYMGINCACFTPNTGRFDDVVRLAKEYDVDGVIDVTLKFCQTYDIEGATLEKRLQEENIPVLRIETDYTDADAQQLKTRIEAFCEVIGE